MTTPSITHLLLAALTSAVATTAGWSQILADDCEDAPLIHPNITVMGPGLVPALNTDGASTCGGERDVWYRYTPATSGAVSVEMTGGFFDLSADSMPTALSIHTACPGSVEDEVVCAAGSSGEVNVSTVQFAATADTTYYIRCARILTGDRDDEGPGFSIEVAGPALAGSAAADLQVPPLFNYQAILRNGATGEGLADGLYTLTFEIFSHPLSEEASVWGPQTIANIGIAEGYANVLLGPVDDEGDPIAQAFLGEGTDIERFMQITVDGNGVDSEVIAPRQQLGVTPFALRAPRAAGFAQVGAQDLLFNPSDPSTPPWYPVTGAAISLESNGRPVLLGFTAGQLQLSDNTFGNSIRFVRVQASGEEVIESWSFDLSTAPAQPVSLWAVDVDPPLDNVGYRVDWRIERIFLGAGAVADESQIITPSIAVFPGDAHLSDAAFFASDL